MKKELLNKLISEANEDLTFSKEQLEKWKSVECPEKYDEHREDVIKCIDYQVRDYESDIEEVTSILELLEEMKEYYEKKESGFLVELPCKVGDTVWCIFEAKVYKAIAQKITIVSGRNNYQLVKIEAEFNIVDPFYNDGRLRKYGIYQNYLETVFLSEEKANQKLAELRKAGEL